MNTPARTIHSVAELAEILRALIEDSLPRLWVEGEISNFSRPASGHWYFTLKDERAQIRCAMFRNANYLTGRPPANGDRVLVRAQAGYYAARGDLQLICEHLEPAGQGALLREFEALKRRLSAEGLFDAARKRPLPASPRRIGLVTSATGAAVQDVIAALGRRFPLLQVLLWPVPVQGAAAAPAIVRALQRLPARHPVDLVLLVRGGGSLEDLWAFNEEAIARAIAACTVPVVTGIGHEIDFTMADFAADLRAPTPTAAAELVSPDQHAVRRQLEDSGMRLGRVLTQSLQRTRHQLAQLNLRLRHRHPQRQLLERAQTLDRLGLELAEAQASMLSALKRRQSELDQRLRRHRPGPRLAAARAACDLLTARLARAMQSALRQRQDRWRQQHAVLASVSPQAVLARGYAIARDLDGKVLRDPAEVSAGQPLDLVLARGGLRVKRTD